MGYRVKSHLLTHNPTTPTLGNRHRHPGESSLKYKSRSSNFKRVIKTEKKVSLGEQVGRKSVSQFRV